MSDNKNENVVIAFFDNEIMADDAVDMLKTWDKANREIQLGAIGLITKEDGKIKTSLGRKTGKGAAVGATIGVIGAVLTGGASLIGSALGTGLVGGAVGAFMKNSINLTEPQIEQIGAELDAGRIAVVVACDVYEVEPTSNQLVGAGGQVRQYLVPTAAFEEAARAIADDADRPATEVLSDALLDDSEDTA